MYCVCIVYMCFMYTCIVCIIYISHTYMYTYTHKTRRTQTDNSYTDTVPPRTHTWANKNKSNLSKDSDLGESNPGFRL
jgi:uncharacterized ion transporter superfamily protein YfcC